jgi:hypothetical protein
MVRRVDPAFFNYEDGSSRLHGITSQKIETFIFAVVGTSYLT